jgi:hypothetical protein
MPIPKSDFKLQGYFPLHATPRCILHLDLNLTRQAHPLIITLPAVDLLVSADILVLSSVPDHPKLLDCLPLFCRLSGNSKSHGISMQLIR